MQNQNGKRSDLGDKSDEKISCKDNFFFNCYLIIVKKKIKKKKEIV